MVALMAAYQDQLKDLGLSGLGIRPLPHPLKAIQRRLCRHRRLQELPRRIVPRLEEDRPTPAPLPRCKTPIRRGTSIRSASVATSVGWNPTKFFPYQSGYLSEKETPKLINVGCEDCHGPGQKHVRAENHGTPAQQVAARKTVVITQGGNGRSELAEAELLVVPRPGQQPRVQVRSLLAVREALRARVGQLAPRRCKGARQQAISKKNNTKAMRPPTVPMTKAWVQPAWKTNLYAKARAAIPRSPSRSGRA